MIFITTSTGNGMFASTTCSASGDNLMVSSEDCGGTTIATMFNFPLNQMETINGMDDLHRKHIFSSTRFGIRHLITVCSRC
jgi:hypothetical protein